MAMNGTDQDPAVSDFYLYVKSPNPYRNLSTQKQASVLQSPLFIIAIFISRFINIQIQKMSNE
jgi:hypothetical protein